MVNGSFFIFDERSALISVQEHRYSLSLVSSVSEVTYRADISSHVGVAAIYRANTRLVRAVRIGNFGARGHKVEGTFRRKRGVLAHIRVPAKSIVIPFPALAGVDSLKAYAWH